MLLLSCDENGERFLGGYGLHREIYKCQSVEITGVIYTSGQALVLTSENNILPKFVTIQHILSSDERDCFFICKIVIVLYYSSQLQAYEIVETTDMFCLCNLDGLVSPWPLIVRTLKEKQYIASRHKLWYDSRMLNQCLNILKCI